MSIEIRYLIVDVFSERPLAGNALCVVLDAVPEPVMQAIAREVNLSETTFVNQTGDDSYDVRIFTPAEELPFAGHPTLGSAWVLGPGRWTQRSPGATVVVDVDEAGASFVQDRPRLIDVDPEPGTDALGLPPSPAAVVGEGGLRHYFVVTDAPLSRLRPDMAAIERAARAMKTTGVAAVRPVGAGEVEVRLFVPGIGEDPGTGSAAAAVALLAGRYGAGPVVTIHQGVDMGRPCRIEVEALDGDGQMRVGGAVAACAIGRFTL